MHSHYSPSKQGAYDVPNLKPEAGLAEWTSKIKAMQRQVDADEEAEQKRLEEEIAASRLARLRRSQGVGYSGRTNSVDMSKVNEYISADSEDDGATNETMKTTAERQSKQEDALRRLTTDDPPNALAGSPVIQPPVGTAAPPVSLAAFMGGRATGPRLNRHAPQQDGHDGSQFQQPRYDLAPHLTFGRGGVAMPGMAQRNTKATESDRRASETNKRNWPAPLHSPKIINPNATSMGASTNQPKDYTPLVRTPDLRERTKSTPSFELPKQPIHHPTAHPTTTTATNNIAFDINQDRDTYSHRPSTTSVLSSNIIQPESSRRLSDSVSAIPQKSPVTVNSLARPIRPQPRVSSSLPQTPPSQIPSPAFLRLPPQKDPTPSISRLQGRGFVQSMVKVSTQLESPPVPSDKTPEKGSTSGGRRVSVLDRWQQNNSPRTSSPPASPTPKPTRRSVTADLNLTNLQQAQFSRQTSPNKPLKSTTSSPSLRPLGVDVPIPIQSYNKQDGLGSATTLLVYKPKLTAPPSQRLDVDELGFQKETTGATAVKSGRELPTPSGSPLSHLTKDRARKPRKARYPDPKPRGGPPAMTSAPEPLRQSIQPPSEAAMEVQPAPSLILPQPSASDPSQPFKNIAQSQTAVVTTPNVVPNPPKLAPPILLGGEGLSIKPHISRPPPARADEVSTPIHVDSPIANLYETEREDKYSSQQSPKHSRIPSTGKRATVMDVAQALHDQSSKQAINSVDEISPNSNPPRLAVSNQPRTTLPFTINGEKPKSSYEKYSSIILPPLKEEATPVPSPAGSLSRVLGGTQRQTLGDPSFQLPLAPSTLNKVYTQSENTIALQTASIDIILESYQPSVIPSPISQSISVDVMIITGNTATSLSQEKSIFYDTEILAIIHRSKSLESGLVSTVVWGWQGKHGTLGEKEERKLQELAKRYGTTAHVLYQDSEQSDFVQVLGGRLAVRQGTRIHWTPENTAMHLVRSKGGVIFIDEHDLNINHLCSAFSYCISILDTVYVWHGHGSTIQEQEAALQYARSLEKGGSPTVELSEGGNDDDEMFWILLGNEEFASADYWRWRKTSSVIDPHIWRVDAALGEVPVLLVDSFSDERAIHSSVYIIDCVWEFYILVGRDARRKKRDITLAINITSGLSTRVAPERPYTPTIHVLLLPTQLPRDLRLNLRGLNEQFLNNGGTPDYMNILSFTDASTHVHSAFWDQVISQDRLTLPLDILL